MRVSAWLFLFQQTLSSFFLLWSAALSAGLTSRPLRALTCAGLPALLTMLAPPLPSLVRLALLPLTALLPLAAFPEAPRSMRLRLAALGLVLPMALTGLMRLISPLGLPGTLLLMGGCALLLCFSRALSACGSVPRCTGVEIRMGGRRTSLTALVDSGNLLRDAFTGLPVIVISRRAASRLMTLPPEGSLLPGMRLMRVRTVSGVTLMTVLRPDSVRIHQGRRWEEAHALIGLSPLGYEGFQALLPASLAAGGEPLPSRKAI